MLIIRRKNLVVGLLVVLLVITGYLNFLYNQNSLSTINPGDETETQVTNNGDVSVVDVEDNKDKTVTSDDPKDSVAVSSSSFFRDYRFERETVRKNEIDYINTIINNPKSDKEIINEAQSQLLELTVNMESEMMIESLIKAKGFDDIVAIIHNNNVSVIVDKKELAPDEVAQILDIVRKQTNEKPENIKIIPKI